MNIDNIKKYMEFKGTISGSNYILRNILASVCAFISGFIIAFNTENLILIILGLLIFIPTLWFSIATIYKRINAFYPEQVVLFTTILSVTQVLNELGKNQIWGKILTVILIIVGIFLIFSNSNIENHEG
jgi:uncharacterized membrane protein YhaH (DUF805 family)